MLYYFPQTWSDDAVVVSKNCPIKKRDILGFIYMIMLAVTLILFIYGATHDNIIIIAVSLIIMGVVTFSGCIFSRLVDRTTPQVPHEPQSVTTRLV